MKSLFSTLAFILFCSVVSAQSSTNPWVYAGPDLSLPCGQNCTDLSASYLRTSASDNTYTLDTIPFAPFPYLGGTPCYFGTPPSPFQDDFYGPVINLPFTFCFFGNYFSQVVIGSNAIVSFNTAYSGNSCPWPLTSGATLPTASFGNTLNSIMGAYMDIDVGRLRTTPADSVWCNYKTVGIAPNRAFVVSFYQSPFFTNGQCDSFLMTSQMVLYESSNIIDIFVENKSSCAGWNRGLAIEGIQDATGTIAYTVPGRNNSVWSAYNDARRFRPSGSVRNYSFAWYQGSTLLGNTDTIRVCPPNNSTTTYIAQATYYGCDSSTTIVADTVTIHILQSAGSDQYLSCPTSIDSVVMAAAGTGTWAALPTNPAATTITDPTSPTTSISGFPAVPGIYRYVWSSAQCTDTANVIVTLRPNAGPDVSICVGGTATMAALGGGTWSELAGIPASTGITNIHAANTTITGFSVGGRYGFIWTVGTCTDTAFVIIPPFSSSASAGSASLCKYQITTLSVTASPLSAGPFTYSWTSASSVVSPLGATTATRPLQAPTYFYVRVTNAAGCSLIDTVFVNMSGAAPRIVINPSSNDVCPGDTVNLNANVVAESLVPCGHIDTCSDNSFLRSAPNAGDPGFDTSSTTGNGSFTSVPGAPFRGGFNSYKAQYLYRASELNAMGLSSGTFTDISFFVKTVNSTAVYDTFAVSMACTGLDSLTDFVNTGFTEVYPPSSVVPSLQWTSLPFSTFYGWDGVSNLIIQVCYTFDPSATSNDDFVSFVTTPYQGATVWAGDLSGNGCAYTSRFSTFNNGIENTRPVIRFGQCVPNELTYHWSPSTICCDTCPSTCVQVNGTSTYRLTVNNNGCANTDSVTMRINPYLAISAGPDINMCSSGLVQLHVALDSTPPSVCLQNYFVSSIPYNALTGTQTIISDVSYFDAFAFNDTDNGTSGPINLPFPFPFYCDTFTQFWANANAWISFLNPYPATGGGFIAQFFPPSAFDIDPRKEIALMVGDYAVSATSTVGYFTAGTAPNRTFVIQYNNLTDVSGLFQTNGQIQLHEGGAIDIMLQSSNYSGREHTTGIKSDIGVGVAAPGRNFQQYTISTPEGWHFQPQNGANVLINHAVWTPGLYLNNDTILNPLSSTPTSQTYIVSADVLINRFTSPEVCHVSDSVRVNISRITDSLTVSPSLICPGDTAQLRFTSTGNIATITWTPAANVFPSSGSPTPLVSVVDSAWIRVLATDQAGCQIYDSVKIRNLPAKQTSLGPDIAYCSCAPDTTVTARVVPVLAGDTYLWSDGSTASSITFAVPVSSVYTLTVTDLNHCRSTASINVNISCLDVHPIADPDSVISGAQYLLRADSLGLPGVSYQWWPADTNIATPNQEQTKAKAGAIGIDTFYLFSVNAMGCRDTNFVIVNVVPPGGIAFPTGFSPNGDGNNDAFVPVIGAGSRIIAFRIYNRWGQSVHDNPNIGWDGNYDGNPQTVDTYTYFVTVESPDKQDAAKKVLRSVQGTFQLLR